MGIEPFLLASTLRVLEAQRLISAALQGVQGALRVRRGNGRPARPGGGLDALSAQGFDQCRGGGYRGRVGVFEVVRITATWPA